MTIGRLKILIFTVVMQLYVSKMKCVDLNKIIKINSNKKSYNYKIKKLKNW